ncbi:MAG: hypothetical protein QXL10_00975 [Candidatus Bathyarchaeia archaeon]
MREEVLELDDRFGREYAGRYVFREITWGKRNRIIQRHTRYNKFTGEVESSDLLAIQAETIMASLHVQPDNKPITLERLLGEEDGVPIGLGELFAQIANRLNGMEPEAARFLSEPLDVESRIQQSPSSASARSSGGQ